MTTPLPSTNIQLLTPLKPGAVGVIRLTGPRALAIIKRVFLPRRDRELDCLPDQRLVFGRLIENGEPLDEVVLTISPHTCGHAIDLIPHGGVRILQRIILLLERCGATLVEPDDATWPAKNMIQREVDTLLPKAKTRRVARWLAAQRTLLPNRLATLIDQISQGHTEKAALELNSWLDRFPVAQRLITGADVALLGPANAGKSTLANRLVGTERSIVAARPGTTRDWVSTSASLQGVPVELIDTAGLDRMDDGIEGESIRRGLERIATADIHLWVLDGSRPLSRQIEHVREFEAIGTHRLIVLNKSDLIGVPCDQDLPPEMAERSVTVSALCGHGMDGLIQRVLELLNLGTWRDDHLAIFTPRQREGVRLALSAIPGNADDAARILRDEVLE